MNKQGTRHRGGRFSRRRKKLFHHKDGPAIRVSGFV